MIPRPDQALLQLAARLGSSLASELQTSYAASEAGLMSMLLMALAGEAAHGVERRMADGRALKELFAEARHAPGAERRQSFRASEPASFDHQAVSDWLDGGLELLIDLHGWAEREDQGLNKQIWDFLVDHTERHRLNF